MKGGSLDRKNTIYIICAASSVILSGSLLAMVLLIFPLMRLPIKLRFSLAAILPILIIGDYYFTSSGVASRLVSIFSEGFNISGLFGDASLNLRVGHIYFTMFENLIPSMLLISPIDFKSQYNAFANETGLLIETGTNYILPALGEMIYGSGFLAIILMLYILNRAKNTCMTNIEKLEKIIFIIACMLNPITISNIFLIMYILKDESKREIHSHKY